MLTITLHDETFTGDSLRHCDVSLHPVTTVRDIIAARVTAEVRRYNERPADYFQGLVQPGETEATLNGYHVRKHRRIDLEKQVYTALDAFQKNGYFVLIDNIQAESLTQKVSLSSSTRISFLKLTPLVGG